MLFISLALAAAAQIPASPPPSQTYAKVSVRIVQGEYVHLGPSPDARLVKASIQTEDGQRRSAFLIEFE